jgi:hypothetical protein
LLLLMRLLVLVLVLLRLLLLLPVLLASALYEDSAAVRSAPTLTVPAAGTSSTEKQSLSLPLRRMWRVRWALFFKVVWLFAFASLVAAAAAAAEAVLSLLARSLLLPDLSATPSPILPSRAPCRVLRPP